jgi:2-polyprenyl-6-methoxyphenol hydroxylase-like FAD-dependent oxidoreductase
VKRLRDHPVVVLGAGPVGMVAALELSKRSSTTLLARQLPSANDPPRVEAVPASLLALLLDYGIHPRQIGVDRLHESHRMAWEQDEFIESRSPVAAHVERPALDLALLNVVLRSRRINVKPDQPAMSFATAIQAARNQEVRLIDATGRRAVSARQRMHPSQPWAARTFLTLRESCPASTDLSIAGLPAGFVYRLGSAQYIVLGMVGRGQVITGDRPKIENYIHEHGAGRVLDGLPSMAEMKPGSVSVASVQWTSGEVGRRVGDAALARDTLSSQGLAAGISDALYAAAIRSDDDETLLSSRQAEQRAEHLRSLGNSIARCRFREDRAWQEYAEFVAGHTNHREPDLRVALTAGHITTTRSLRNG